MVPHAGVAVALAMVAAQLFAVSGFAAEVMYWVLDLGTMSEAHSVNNGGQVVGYSATSTNQNRTYHAFLYANGAMTDLGTLGGNNRLANGLNNLGQAVGYAENSNHSSGTFPAQGERSNLSFRGIKGAVYRVEYSRSPSAPYWFTLTNVVVTSPSYVVVDPVAPVSGERFYPAVQVP